ncbi:MAG: hypothetical protein ABSF53_18510 [Terracidiphilus sp.]|jgi:hypothetical protein
MRAISAADSVSAAVQRTRDFLFRPFSWGTFLKLGLVAIVTEGLGSNFNSSHHNAQSPGHAPMFYGPHMQPLAWAAAIAMSLLVAIFAAWLFYLITRLRFAFFHCLTHNTREIRPGWIMYAPQATRFFWLNIGVGFSFLLVVVLISLPFIGGFMRLFHEINQGRQPGVGLMLSLLLPLIPIIVLLLLAGILADVILRDWMLPHFALDNASSGEAWSQVRAHMMAEKRQFLAYALLRLVLPLIATIVVFFVLLIPGLVLAGSLAMVELGLHSVFADATGGSAITGVLLQVFFGVLAFGFAVLASICLGGPLSTGTRAYALVFYGGRYQKLGDALYPPISRVA